MEYFDRKIAYLRGMCDGSGFDETTKEGKIFHGILEVLEELANCLEEAINGGELEEEEEEETEYEYSFICPNCGEEIQVEESALGQDGEIACPKCGNIIPLGGADADELKF